MSRLHALLDDYLALRRGLGFKLREQRLLLPGFVDFVEQAGAESVTVEFGSRVGQDSIRCGPVSVEAAAFDGTRVRPPCARLRPGHRGTA